jgi:hypothetical protein
MRDGLILHGGTQRVAPVSGFVCGTRLPTSASTLARFGASDGCVRGKTLPRRSIPLFSMTIPPSAFKSMENHIAHVDISITIESNVTIKA